MQVFYYIYTVPERGIIHSFSHPLISVSGQRRARLMICFIDVVQTFPCTAAHDRQTINPNAERLKLTPGVLGCQ